MPSPGTQQSRPLSPPRQPATAGEGPFSARPLHWTVAGRARYKVRGLYRFDPLKTHLETSLCRNRGIISCAANPLTGNILVIYAPSLSLRDIALAIEEALQGFSQPPSPFAAEGNLPPSPSAVDAGEKRGAKPLPLRKSALRGEEQRQEPWHLIPGAEAAASLGSSVTSGISRPSWQERLARYGPNLLPESLPRSGGEILLSQFQSLPVLLLGASALLSVCTGGLADAAAILAVVGINAAIGYLTESRSEAAIHSLQRLVRPLAFVIRDGVLQEVRGEEVVPGDLLELRPGSYVAADCRILACQNLSIDESALTGESMPALKRAETLPGRDIPLGDRVNVAFMGTRVTGGQGAAVAVATGRFTEIGKVQGLAGRAQAPKTPMERQLDRLGRQLALGAGAVCCAVFAAGLLRGHGLLQMLRSSISLAVAAIPEGLPTIATTVLVLGLRDLRTHRVLIRRLDAVETLGSVQTICLDKTGTLTFNRMSVISVHAGLRRISVREGAFAAAGKALHLNRCPELERMIQVCVLCNEAEQATGAGDDRFSGSPTENALLELALSSGTDVRRLREALPVSGITHRSESRNYMITRHRFGASGAGPLRMAQGEATEGTRELVAVKGSPTEVLAMCGWHLKGGERLPLSGADAMAIGLANERMAGESLRVLGAACRFADGDTELREEAPFTWLGLVGMTDPVKPGLRELIAEFHRAGIGTLMITGDQVPTAYAVGKELNLGRGAPLEIFDSTHLQEIPPDLLAAIVLNVHVFARVSPAQKLQIVQALQKCGRVVGMTGDGINDSPALKAADIGIAMGSSGTDVAREVADLIIEDDNLATMIIAIGHGRAIYSNIRKSVRFLLATNLSEMLLMSCAIALGLGQPLSAMQLLWINLISDIFPGLALALEEPDPGLLRRPPRDPEQAIIGKADLQRISLEGATITAGAMGAYLYGLLRHGSQARAGTLAFMTLTSAQLLHTFGCRSETVSAFDASRLPPNRYLKMALAGSFTLQGLALLIPGLRRLLGVVPISMLDGLVAGGGALLPLVLNEASKPVASGEQP